VVEFVAATDKGRIGEPSENQKQDTASCLDCNIFDQRIPKSSNLNALALNSCCNASDFDAFSLLMNFKGSLAPLILQNLGRGPNHGYRIAQEIKQKSKGVLDFKEGTLYPALHGLEAKGMIASYIQEENGRTRCYYKLTETGKRALIREKQEWMRFSSAISLLLQEAQPN
jgi:DNA-binding PadR family transcriptional regulator